MYEGDDLHPDTKAEMGQKRGEVGEAERQPDRKRQSQMKSH